MSSLFDRLPLVLVATELCSLCGQKDQLALSSCSRMLQSLLCSETTGAASSSSTVVTEYADSDAHRAVRLTLQRSALRILTGATNERSLILDAQQLPSSNRSSEQLSLWLRGPGYRSYHNSSIEVALKPEGGYDLFEQGWLGTTSSQGIVISRAVGASQSDIELPGMEEQMSSSEVLSPFTYAPTSEEDQNSTSGSILASAVANSASATHMQSLENKQASSSSSSQSSVASTWSLLTRWSLFRLRQFLYSIERLSSMRDILQRHGAVCNFGCPEIAQALKQENNDNWSETIRKDFALLGEPVPFLLPWPCAVTSSKNADDAEKRGGAEAPPRLEFGTYTREEEEQILNAWSSGRAKDDWDLSLMCCGLDFDYEKLVPPFVPMLPQHAADLDYDQMSQLLNQYINEGFDVDAGVEVLSGIVRGNAWVCSLANVENVFDHRIEAETKWVVKKINQLLRITPQCQGAVFPRYYTAGYRDVEASCDEHESRKKKAWNTLFQTKVCNGEGKPAELQQGLPQEVADQLRKLLPSSMVVNASSEHVVPWPCLLVAPIAPGWIGGFMSAASLLEA